MRLDTKLYKTESLIDSSHLSQLDDIWDLSAKEITHIQHKYKDDCRNGDYSQYIMNVMYDCYKLGFSKGTLKAQTDNK